MHFLLNRIFSADPMIVFVGNLHIANVVPADSLDGTTYVCIVNNALLGAYVQGNDQTVSPVVRQGKYFVLHPAVPLPHSFHPICYSSSL